METFATIEDVEKLFRPLKVEERERATSLLDVVSHSLRVEAYKVGKDLDLMIFNNESLSYVAKSVTVDIVGRALMTSTDREPMSQFAESALGYSQSGTFLVPGGGLFIKNNELARLGLKRQKMSMVDLYDQGDNC